MFLLLRLAWKDSPRECSATHPPSPPICGIECEQRHQAKLRFYRSPGLPRRDDNLFRVLSIVGGFLWSRGSVASGADHVVILCGAPGDERTWLSATSGQSAIDG